ncbi:GIY-YIG nuclease family protein [Domibacillus aminovorans]|uniref:LuxR family transcriptional regulator n=1 Tax=Domibacillus aminovorans TaxID=29332 RepID=A0A177L726_9BACI|nr:GIY-YIG nuclease family protein [Domibacillus aminovorans]OAH61166.1 LuxR family transcriptional regulator [Domibacillus aminovorans]
MDRKKELKQQYKETTIEAGIYQIKNMVNGKTFIASTRNLKTLNGRKFELEAGSSTHKELQKEWNEFGKDSFEFDVLEVLKKKENGFFDEKRELEKLEEKWLEKLQPYGENGYNKVK